MDTALSKRGLLLIVCIVLFSMDDPQRRIAELLLFKRSQVNNQQRGIWIMDRG